MRVTLAVLACVAAVLLAPAAAGARGPMLRGWIGPPLPVPRIVTPVGTSLTLAQLPILTTYPWAQPGTLHRHVRHGTPWTF